MKILSLVLVSIIIALIIIMFYGRDGTAHVTLVNKSSQQIIGGEVATGSYKAEFGALAPGDSAMITLRVKRDGDYRLMVLFATGNKLEERHGYVTHGMTYQDCLIITDKGAFLNRK